ncbi:hypothetical protein NHQ30_010168 [Ciborinia camelliae]|nr:hypothetical protein NHQ30_010168 [Ciborinia camelliae]
MRFLSATLALVVIFRLTLCDVSYLGTSSATPSTNTSITYYTPSTLVSSVYPTSTVATATDYYTPPYATSESTTTYLTTYTLPTTTTSSTSGTCVSPTFTWTGPTNVPTSLPTYGNYRLGRRADPFKPITPEEIELMKALVALWDEIEKAKPVIDQAIKDHRTDCQDFKDIVDILKKYTGIFAGLQEWLNERGL